TSSPMIAAVSGTMYRTPSNPKGSKIVNAASGPYAAELKASSPNVGIPCVGVIRCPASSEEASGRPNTTSISPMSPHPALQKISPSDNNKNRPKPSAKNLGLKNPAPQR